ncbi:PTS sugar transporter subunit IIB [Pendulispora albinea]|uniref:PTS sugar transporter subunit IIB n=1 Tax=Pendulispora albinea TaxID=2741071 RepID=A0ABZ2LKT6_9BACT
MKRILVACGTGIATSTVVVQKLGELLRKRGLEVRIEQCKASEVESKIAFYDLVVSTTEVGDSKGKPVVRTVSFLTGIGVDRDIERIAQILAGAA